MTLDRKKQRYVPQFYLKDFSYQGDETKIGAGVHRERVACEL